MCIDTSWYEEFVSTVNDFSIFVGDTAGDFGNFSVLDEDISLLRKISIDDSCIFEKIALLESNIEEERFVEKFSHFRDGRYFILFELIRPYTDV